MNSSAVNVSAVQNSLGVGQSSAQEGSAPQFYQPEQLDEQQGLLPLLRRAEIALAQLVNEATDLGGPTLPQWALLYKVYQGDQANTVASLARACRVDTGAMTRLLDRTEKKGLCRRVPSASDRRLVTIELTPKGRSCAECVPALLSQVYNRALARFSCHEWQQLLGLLTRLADDAEQLSVKSGN